MNGGFYLRGLLLGFTIAATVGPMCILCIQRTFQKGYLYGLVSGMGIATADGIYGSIAAFGLTEPEELVEYRFGQAQFTDWLDHIGAERAAQVKKRAGDSARPIMRPYRPVVVFLSSRRS